MLPNAVTPASLVMAYDVANCGLHRPLWLRLCSDVGLTSVDKWHIQLYVMFQQAKRATLIKGYIATHRES